MATEIRTERLTLRAWRTSEVERFCEIYGDERVWRWLGAHPAPLTDPVLAADRIERWEALITGPFGVWAVVPDGSETPAGTVILLQLPDDDGVPTDDVEVGWHFAPDTWGRGYATEAARVLLARAWDHGLAEVHAVVYPGNDRSMAVTQRLGMTDLGVTSQWFGVELRHFLATNPDRV